MNARRLARGTRSFIALSGSMDLSPLADGNARIINPTRSTEIAVFTNTPYVSRLRPKHRQPRAFLAEAPLLSTSAKNRCGFGSIDCSLRLHSASSTPPRYASVAWRYIPAALANYLHTYIPTLPPTPPAAPTVSGPFLLRCAPKPPLAIPGRRCHAAALHPPVGASRQSPGSSHP